ncbi:hypothetical protein A1O1_08043 [Capronia coronata CBS 617.96]|uniref:Luciferase domain-containing protein n=1 Tax=Capronia coronata CBS 617.96 TaxID=1182541 RepID=W9XYF7_9EURO|nr:uncharacterized protein A1O1_08043 [Capronia coronata CBS 617.96]EXJ81976.1 hypothetical protein A1O1_08043 [Capronia coronata CBS 617.96]
MAIITSHLPPIFYAIAAILIGTALITYMLEIINVDITALFRSKKGRLGQSAYQPICERFLKTLAISDPTHPPSISSSICSRGYLETLPVRSGPRPTVTGISQPRQTTQLPCLDKEAEIPSRLRDVITATCVRYPTTTYLGSSTFEIDGPVTLYARQRIFNETQYYGEILRADRAGGLIQCTLHPCDVKTVIEKGWGQRHPLTTRLASWFAMHEAHISHSPESRVVLYAPRSQAELEVLKHIMQAAVWGVGGIDPQIDDEKV